MSKEYYFAFKMYNIPAAGHYVNDSLRFPFISSFCSQVRGSSSFFLTMNQHGARSLGFHRSSFCFAFFKGGLCLQPAKRVPRGRALPEGMRCPRAFAGGEASDLPVDSVTFSAAVSACEKGWPGTQDGLGGAGMACGWVGGGGGVGMVESCLGGWEAFSCLESWDGFQLFGGWREPETANACAWGNWAGPPPSSPLQTKKYSQGFCCLLR